MGERIPTGGRPFRPKKRLGQHFLIDRSVARKMVGRMELQETDRVVEIGPGKGMMTAVILEETIEKVVGIEIDPLLCQLLRDQFEREQRLQLLQGDYLLQDLRALMGEAPVRIVGNIPYAITSPILFKTLDDRAFVTDATLMIQKEVGERLVSGPGSKTYGIPSVIFQLFADVERWFSVSRTSFRPIPRVDSVVVSIRFLKSPRYRVEDVDFFIRLLKTIFGQRRKMLRNSMKTIIGEEIQPDHLPVDGTKRPEELSVEQLVGLANHIVSYSSGRIRGRKVE